MSDITKHTPKVLTKYFAEGYDYALLRRYMKLFPSAPLAKVVHAYFRYTGIRVSEDDEDLSHYVPQRPSDEVRDDALADLTVNNSSQFPNASSDHYSRTLSRAHQT